MQTQIDSIQQTLATWLERIPFPNFLRRVLQALSSQVARLHPRAPLGLALLVGFVIAESVLWIARQPLYFFWEVFGLLSGNNSSILTIYNVLAHTIAFGLAAKFIYELLPAEGTP